MDHYAGLLVGSVRPGGKLVNMGSHSATRCKRCARYPLFLRAVTRSAFFPTVEGADDRIPMGKRVEGLGIEILVSVGGFPVYTCAVRTIRFMLKEHIQKW